MGNDLKPGKKRTQRDYTLGFKLSVVRQVGNGDMTYKQAQDTYGIQGRSTVLKWLRKHGALDWKKPKIHGMPSPNKNETPAQKIKRLEKELLDAKLKNEVLEKMIELSGQQYGTSIRKKCSSKQSEAWGKKKVRASRTVADCLE